MDQTKTHGLSLALNSLESAFMVCDPMGQSDPDIRRAIGCIKAAKTYIKRALHQQLPTVFVGERRTK